MNETGLVPIDKLRPLLIEANELTAIFTAIGKTAKENQRNSKIDNKKIKKSKIELPNSEIS